MQQQHTHFRTGLVSIALAALLAAIVLALPAFAQQAEPAATAPAEDRPPVASSLQAMIVTRDDEGNEVMAPAERVDPGSVIEYRIAHRNQSGDALTGFIVQGPIPEGTAFVGDSARSGEAMRFEVLVPGEDWQTEPAYKTIVNDDGEKQRVLAAPSEYRTVRWVLTQPLADETAATAVYRVRVAAE
ncbi:MULTISPECIES: hypothetical protein [unclassified Roseitalea]|uniref:hypothetical protein n=1 Tax=unclassified Roseitalea TaxID=2639107 RepID=UPI00273EAB18|nr:MULTISPECIES: hypothetical protein [unclassified Roseitalea]